MGNGNWIPRPIKGRIENDCLHLLWCVANNKCPPPQSYKSLSVATGIPPMLVWELVNTDKEILKSYAYKHNYSLKIILSEDYIIDVVYNGPMKPAQLAFEEERDEEEVKKVK